MGGRLEYRPAYPPGREAYRPGAYDEPFFRKTYSVGVHIVHDRRRKTGFRVNTAYPLNEDLFLKKGVSPSQAFINFSRGLISDFDLFENDAARINLGLNCLMIDGEDAEDSLQASSISSKSLIGSVRVRPNCKKYGVNHMPVFHCWLGPDHTVSPACG